MPADGKWGLIRSLKS